MKETESQGQIGGAELLGSPVLAQQVEDPTPCVCVCVSVCVSVCVCECACIVGPGSGCQSPDAPQNSCGSAFPQAPGPSARRGRAAPPHVLLEGKTPEETGVAQTLPTTFQLFLPPQ